jgi:hypothetical protein
MDLQTWGTLISVVVAIVAVFFAGHSMYASKDSAKAARDSPASDMGHRSTLLVSDCREAITYQDIVLGVVVRCFTANRTFEVKNDALGWRPFQAQLFT